MRLYLVQHGEAKAEQIDPERRLTDKGRRDVEKVSSFLKRLDLRVAAIWHSGKPRAAETARILAAAVAADGGIVRRDGLAPNDPIAPIRQDVNRAENDLMIVGHLPFLSRLASALGAGGESADAVAFRNGGVVCLERDHRQLWRLGWIVTPELLP